MFNVIKSYFFYSILYLFFLVFFLVFLTNPLILVIIIYQKLSTDKRDVEEKINTFYFKLTSPFFKNLYYVYDEKLLEKFNSIIKEGIEKYGVYIPSQLNYNPSFWREVESNEFDYFYNYSFISTEFPSYYPMENEIFKIIHRKYESKYIDVYSKENKTPKQSTSVER